MDMGSEMTMMLMKRRRWVRTCMREISGDMTMASPPKKTGGNWKQRDFPKPVAITTTCQIKIVFNHHHI